MAELRIYDVHGDCNGSSVVICWDCEGKSYKWWTMGGGHDIQGTPGWTEITGLKIDGVDQWVTERYTESGLQWVDENFGPLLIDNVKTEFGDTSTGIARKDLASGKYTDTYYC